MNFFGLKDKLDDFKYSLTTGDKLINGARVVGTVVANTAIAAGKVAAKVAEKLPEELEKQKNR